MYNYSRKNKNWDLSYQYNFIQIKVIIAIENNKVDN